jgi:DNA-binding response OmpR family regulator
VRVLVVEDERDLADAIARGLRHQGMAVDVAYNGGCGHFRAMTTRYVRTSTRRVKRPLTWGRFPGQGP